MHIPPVFATPTGMNFSNGSAQTQQNPVFSMDPVSETNFTIQRNLFPLPSQLVNSAEPSFGTLVDNNSNNVFLPSESAVQSNQNPKSFAMEEKVQNCLIQDAEISDEDIEAAKAGYKTGRWTREEHKLFLQALQIYGKNWKLVQKHVGTRSTTQARSHAQKYFIKMERNHENGEEVEGKPIAVNIQPSLQISTPNTQATSPLDNPQVKVFEVNSKKLSMTPKIVKCASPSGKRNIGNKKSEVGELSGKKRKQNVGEEIKVSLSQPPILLPIQMDSTFALPPPLLTDWKGPDFMQNDHLYPSTLVPQYEQENVDMAMSEITHPNIPEPYSNIPNEDITHPMIENTDNLYTHFNFDHLFEDEGKRSETLMWSMDKKEPI